MSEEMIDLKKMKKPKKRKKDDKTLFDNIPSVMNLMMPDALEESRDKLYLGPNRYTRNFVLTIYPTEIYVKKMDDYEILKYVDSYNVYDKAGAYAIQSPFAMYIEKMVGDYYSVVGLPINRVYDILKQKELL